MVNYFEFLGLTPSFYPDAELLKKAYYANMRKLHPDMHMTASVEEKTEILQQSSYNNEAYKTLKDFHSRLEYIVSEYANSDDKYTLPQMFLMEMMDINEEVMEVQMDYTEEQARSIESSIQQQEAEMLKSIEPLLNSANITSPLSSEVTKAIQEYLLKRNYLNRILVNLDKARKEK